jgi:hypothetical protein
MSWHVRRSRSRSSVVSRSKVSAFRSSRIRCSEASMVTNLCRRLLPASRLFPEIS